MVEKDYKLYGTKILNLKTQEIGLLICLWENKFADKTVDFATCVDKTGKRYNIELDNIMIDVLHSQTYYAVYLLAVLKEHHCRNIHNTELFG